MKFSHGPSHEVTYPSFYDGMPQQGRIYLPQDLRFSPSSKTLYGAVIAHPYAPLGGSQEDHVVVSITQILLELGFIVGTFNFRGSLPSGGRASWSGRPEILDYKSFLYVFNVYLMLYGFTVTGTPSAVEPQHRISLIIGGYSYGSLIASRIPSVQNIHEIFEAESPANDEQKRRIASLRDAARKLIPDHYELHVAGTTKFDSLVRMDLIKTHRLLISPLMPPVAGLVSLFSGYSTFFTNMSEYDHLTQHPTLAVWGENDGFTAHKRLKKWGEALTAPGGWPQFQYSAVPEVDHSWRTPSPEVAFTRLRAAMVAWVEGLTAQVDRQNNADHKAPPLTTGED